MFLAQLGEEGLHGVEGSSAGELVDDGEVGFVVVAEVRVVVTGVVEDLEGEVEVVLAGDHGDQAFWGEAFGPGRDWGCHGVGFQELLLRFHGGDVLLQRVGQGRLRGGGGGAG